MELLKVDITKCWLDYHFKSKDEQLAYYQLIYKYVYKACSNYWNNPEFLRFISNGVIRYLAKRDSSPFSDLIFEAITDVFFDTHLMFFKKYAK